jgi:ribose/xylose/arabinose/galactoside ABC-type transport system permease subunit
MIFVNVSPFWIQAIQGLLILATVLIDLARRQPRRRKKRAVVRGSHAAS